MCQSSALGDAFKRYEALNDEGRFKEALPFAKWALELGRRAFGSDDQNTAKMMVLVADLYDELDRNDEAEAHYKRALEIFEKVIGSENTHIAKALNNLGSLYQKLGRNVEAEPLFKRAHDKAELVFLGSGRLYSVTDNSAQIENLKNDKSFSRMSNSSLAAVARGANALAEK